MTLRRFLMMVLGLSLAAAFSPLAAAEESLSYDKYAEAVETSKTSFKALTTLSHLPVYPFEILHYPLDKTLVWVEKYHIPKKIEHLYDVLDSKGITPELGLVGPTSINVGTSLDLVRLFQQKERFPDLRLENWVYYASDVQFNLGSKVGLERIGGTGFHTQALVQYETRPNEHFYGIGTHSSQGEGSVYEREETVIEGLLGYKPGFVHALDFKFAYHNVNTSGGKDGGRGQIGMNDVFDSDSVPGLDGDEFLEFKTEWMRDTRNQKGNSTEGGYQRAAWSFNEGVGGSNARYFKYQLETAKYLALGTPKKILGFHALAEHNDKIGRHNVPFHQMPRLGGHSYENRLSHPLRGFDYDRFTDDSALLFNLEYRYNIWEYREFKTEAVFFWDEGQVFHEISDFCLNDFRESYGTGLRFSLANEVVLSLEVAHGDEGTNFYAKSSAPF